MIRRRRRAMASSCQVAAQASEQQGVEAREGQREGQEAGRGRRLAPTLRHSLYIYHSSSLIHHIIIIVMTRATREQQREIDRHLSRFVGWW